ncbi:hypothetical protein EJ110_NYTH44260 [Nymphaea thermarum]|nr:hypothetical protein EJ110_NYTH44260 [Nymphaea thermarum]
MARTKVLLTLKDVPSAENISERDIAGISRELGLNFTREDIQEMIEEADRDGKGCHPFAIEHQGEEEEREEKEGGEEKEGEGREIEGRVTTPLGINGREKRKREEKEGGTKQWRNPDLRAVTVALANQWRSGDGEKATVRSFFAREEKLRRKERGEMRREGRVSSE